MSISSPFIRRPVATTLLTVAIAIAGGIAFEVLPVAPLPEVDFPTISVSAGLPGASAEIMASSVATPLERQFGHIAGVTEMTSASTLGSTSITIQFDLSRDIDGAARDVEAAINAARTYLPANLPGNPTYRKVNPADAPIMILGLTSDKYGPEKMYDEASTVMQQKLSQIQGVGQVTAGGGALPSVRVDANPTQLASYGITLANVQSVLSLQNADLAKGQISDGLVTADILANDQISKADDYKPLVVGYNHGAAIRLSDVAQVTDSVQNVRAAGYLSGKRAVTVIIFRQPGANIIDTVDRIRAELPSIQASIPLGIDTTIVLDRTTTIRASVGDVERTLLISIGLVIVVVFVFLRNARATLIPGVAVPVSLIGTFAVMYLFGYTLDNLSLMAMTISTGFVVDDAIVVMENIARHLENGMKPFAAALKGAEEIGFTVFTISISLIAVFIPLLLMGGIVGRLFREFAVTLSTAIVVSMIVSLTTTPMMCAYLLKNERAEKHGRIYMASEKFFDRVLSLYRGSLRWVLDNPTLTLVVLFLTIALNVVLIVKIPKGFFPEEDTGAITGGVRGPQDSSFPAMNNAVQQIVGVVKKDPAIENVIAFTGGNGATNTGNLYIALKPLAARKVSAAQIIDRLRPQLNRLPVASAFLQAVQDLRIGGRGGNAMYQYTIQSDSVQDLSKWGPVLLDEMKRLPGFQDVSSDQQNGGLDELMTYDRATAARLGLTVQSLDSALYGAFGQSEVSIIYTQLNQYYVVLEVAPQYWQSPAGLKDIYLHTSGNGNIPLLTVAKGQANTTPLAINHTGLFPSVTVSFNLSPNVSLSDATQSISQMQKRLGAPSTLQGFFAGTLLAYQQSLGTEPILILTALLAVYIVLGVLYESLVHPLTIISTLPSASVGAMLALLLFKEDLNIISIIGIVLLIGIVKKNAIMMIDFALQAQRLEGKSPAEAIFEACMLRFRPILMTTMAALLGALPLALGTGTGYELRRPLGITIVGGLILSQMLTLYTTPVVYLAFDRIRLRMQGKERRSLSTGPGHRLMLRTNRNGHERGHGASENMISFHPRTMLCLAMASCLLAGCTVGPKYHTPAAETPAAYKELTPADFQNTDGWKVAQPKDDALRGKWWEIFNDPQLNALEEKVNVSNQNIAAAAASFLAARALVKEARSQLFPSVTTNPSITVQRPSSTISRGTAGSSSNPTSGSSPPSTGTFADYTLPFDATWQPDLFGRIRNTVGAAASGAQASAADLENTRLTVQADVAADYFQLRGQDALKQLLDSTVVAYQQTLDVTRAQYETGVGTAEAVAQAETQLKATEAQDAALGIQRAQFEHAIAMLTGKPASAFSMPFEALKTNPPAIPYGVPSQLLERRPDIAAAERLVAQANAQIGIARAAYFPTVTLSAAAGFESSSITKWFSWPSLFFSAGPAATEILFDAGLRRATIAQFRAQYDQTVANYRQAVLTAFQQVEDNLASLRILSVEIQDQDAAVTAAERSLALATDRYQLGIDPYLNVITAQTALLSNREIAVNLRIQQMTASGGLIEALGGGWDASQLPSPAQLSSKIP